MVLPEPLCLCCVSHVYDEQLTPFGLSVGNMTKTCKNSTYCHKLLENELNQIQASYWKVGSAVQINSEHRAGQAGVGLEKRRDSPDVNH